MRSATNWQEMAGRIASGPRPACRWQPISPAQKSNGFWITSPGRDKRAEKGELLFGNMDTWVIWNMTGVHVTDVTNASRTLLMDLKTLDWDEEILQAPRHSPR